MTLSSSSTTRSLRRTLPPLALAVCGALLAACSGAGGAGGGGAHSINVLMVNNPQMADLQKLTAENFTKTTGIKVNFTVLPENDVRDKISQDFSSQAGQYDVGHDQQLRGADLRQERLARPADRDTAKDDRAFDQSDILPAMHASR